MKSITYFVGCLVVWLFIMPAPTVLAGSLHCQGHTSNKGSKLTVTRVDHADYIEINYEPSQQKFHLEMTKASKLVTIYKLPYVASYVGGAKLEIVRDPALYNGLKGTFTPADELIPQKAIALTCTYSATE